MPHRLLLLTVVMMLTAACGAPTSGTLPTLAVLPTDFPPTATLTIEPTLSPTATARNTVTVTVPPASPTHTLTSTVAVRVPPTAVLNEETRIAQGGRSLGLGAVTSTATQAAGGGTSVEITVVPDAIYRPIVVAARSLPLGTMLTAEDVRLANFPESAIPTSAITDLSQVIGQTARINFYCGMPIIADGIGTPESAAVGTPPELEPMNCDLPDLVGSVELVPVVIAVQTIPAGEYIPEEAVVLFSYPRLWLPPGALYGGEDAVDGRALIDIPREGLILASMVGDENPNASDEESAPSGP
jgi:flagella basal body P-ring formation protein FlgA